MYRSFTPQQAREHRFDCVETVLYDNLSKKIRQTYQQEISELPRHILQDQYVFPSEFIDLAIKVARAAADEEHHLQIEELVKRFMKMLRIDYSIKNVIRFLEFCELYNFIQMDILLHLFTPEEIHTSNWGDS